MFKSIEEQLQKLDIFPKFFIDQFILYMNQNKQIEIN